MTAPQPPERSGRQRAAWVLALGLAAAGLSAAIALRQTPHQHTDLAGRGAPEFTLPLLRLEGGPTQMRIGPQDLRGKPLLLHFWAPSCAPCVQELPRWQALWQREKDGQGLQILTVAGDESLDAIAFLRKRGYTFPAVHDATGLAHRAWGVDGIPFSAAISASGQVVGSVEGPLSESGLAELAELARTGTAKP